MALRKKLGQLERQAYRRPSEELLEEWYKAALRCLSDHEFSLIDAALEREGDDLTYLTEEEQAAFAQFYRHVERVRHVS